MEQTIPVHTTGTNYTCTYYMEQTTLDTIPVHTIWKNLYMYILHGTNKQHYTQDLYILYETNNNITHDTSTYCLEQRITLHTIHVHSTWNKQYKHYIQYLYILYGTTQITLYIIPTHVI